MALTGTNIIGRIALPDDTNPINSVVRFTMTGFDTEAGADATVIPIPVDATIDALGNIDVNLWPNPLGVRTTFYSVVAKIPDGNTIYTIDIYLGQISVPSTGGPYDLNDLLPIAPPAGATVSDYIAQLAAAVASTEANATTASDAAAAAVISAAQAALYDGVWLDDVSAVVADTALTYTAAQPGTVVAGDYVQTRAEGFSYEVAASGATDQHLTTTGGVKLNLVSNGDSINILALGAIGDGVTDNTAALQNAVNVASRSNTYSVYIPEGHFIYDTLYIFYHETLNPQFQETPTRHGRIGLVGHGALATSNIRSYSPEYGSILEATGAGIIISTNDLGHGVNPYPARNFSAEGITFVANNTGYVIEAASCPIFHLNRCVIYQRNTSGNGVLVQTSWYTDFKHTRFFGVPGSTGTGIVGGSDIFGGLYSLEDSQVDTWMDGIDWQKGVFSNVALSSSAIQNCTRDGIRGSGGTILQLLLHNVYFEGVSRGTDIRGIGATIKHLKADQLYTLCGSATGSSYLSNAVIDLDETSSMELTGVFAQRLVKPFCNVTQVNNFGASSGSVRHFTVSNDFSGGAYAGPAFSLFTGVLPIFGEGITWPEYDLGYNNDTMLIRLFDFEITTPHFLMDRRTGVTSVAAPAFGNTLYFPGQTLPVVVQPSTPHTLIDVEVAAGGGVSIRLPNQSFTVGGRLFIVKSTSTSIADLVVRNNSDNSEILRLKPGQSCIVVYEPEVGVYVPWIEPEIRPQSDIVSLTDLSGGTVQTSVGAIAGSGADAGINDNFATLAEQLDTVLESLRSAGLLN